jgi:pimeloyl-ACP methyl ester carboxylesterase
MLYHDLPPKEAEEWKAKLKPQSLATFQDKTRAAAWRKIPTAYLVCEDDRAIPVQRQDAMIAKIKEGGEIVTERLFVGHSPYINKPDFVAGFLRRAAGENVK